MKQQHARTEEKVGSPETSPDELRDAYVNDQSSCVGECSEGCDHESHCAECGTPIQAFNESGYCIDCEIRWRASHQIGCDQRIESQTLMVGEHYTITGTTMTDHGGNFTPDRIEANENRYWEEELPLVCKGDK